MPEDNTSLPPSKKRTSARDFFLYILSMVTLYWSTASFLTIVFQLINTWVPDLLDSSYHSVKPALRFGISSLIVTFPVYCAATRYLYKDMCNHPEKRSLWVRRWLVYFTLFVASLIIIGDTVSLLNSFLGGELRLRFILKSISLLLVLLALFGYYLHDIRSDDSNERKI